MKRTPLKRKTSLRQGTKRLKRTLFKNKNKYALKRTQLKRKHNSKNDIPKSVKAEVLERSSGICEEPNCKTPNGDFRGLMFCHMTHRQMGGRSGISAKIINDKRNIFRGCGNHHDIVDNRKNTDSPLERLALRAKIKRIIGWYDWATQYNIIENGNKPLNK
jgi:hypothetical protein